jgi:hypothetical protein
MSEVRARALGSFVALCDEIDAFDIEHACFCLGRTRAAYRRLVLRALQGLEDGQLLTLARSGGALRALRLDTLQLFGRDPHRDRLLQEEHAEEEKAAFLRDLASASLVEVPDAGVRCRRCGSNNIAFEFLQTRSADEGTTTYCTCVACAMRWKM